MVRATKKFKALASLILTMLAGAAFLIVVVSAQPRERIGGLEDAINDTGRIAAVQHSIETTVLIRDEQTETWGTGVILTEQGVILTSNHVISGMVEPIITTFDGREYPMAIIKQPDAEGPDIALVGARDTQSLGLGSSPLKCDRPQVSDLVYTVGHPSHGLQFSTSYGRLAKTDVDRKDGQLQLDMSVLPGGSGGGLFNRSGEVIGTVQSVSYVPVGPFGGGAPTGISWAIPSSVICDFIK